MRRVAVAGGEVQTLADQQPFAARLALHGGFVYWTDTVAGTVMRVAVTGGAPATVVAGQSDPTGLVASESCLYFAANAAGTTAGSIRSHDL